MQSDKQAYLDEVATRFRAARGRVKLSRIDFCAKHGLNPHTVHGWELGRCIPASRLIKQFIESLAQEGIFCTEEWLLHEQGQAPVKINLQHQSTITSAAREDDKIDIQTESQCFIDTQTKAGREPVIIEIGDELMSPFFERGDIVGGVVVKQAELLSTKICIIETTPKAYVVRRLLCNADKFLLLSADVTKPLISVDTLNSVAHIIWHRRPVILN